MVQKTITVKMKEKQDAMPAAMLVQIASQFDSSIYIDDDSRRRVNAKSIMGMMTLGFANGETLTAVADGADEEKAVEAITQYLCK